MELEITVAALKVMQVCLAVAGLSITVAAVGCGYAMGGALRNAVDGVARNPEASGKVTVTMLIGMALIEALAIYTLVVSLILIFATPVSEHIYRILGA